jgi:alcohol dehydrogenase
MLPFDFHCPTRILFGPGRMSELGPLAASFGVERVLIVSDPGIEEVGHTQRGVECLQAEGLVTHVFDGLQQNPTTDNVEAGLAVAREFAPQLLIAIGGGSSMDCAKGINFVYSCGGRMQDYWGMGKATGPLLPMIAVPTTAGTGSETQCYALISDAATHVKMACGDKRAAFRVALLDPVLTLTQPPRVTALTGFDALSHALETWVTRPRNAVSLGFSRSAWEKLSTALPRVLLEPNDVSLRGQMQLGAMFAGLAIENSMLGSGHAAANPLTAAYDIAHAEAVGLMLPHVIRRNGPQVESWYRELTGLGAVELADWVARLRHDLGLASTLRECGVARERLPQLAQDATAQWTGRFNPVELSEEDYRALYTKAYD